MAKYRDGWNDPPTTAIPLDHTPTAGGYVHRSLKRGLVAATVAALAAFTYALLPVAFAVGGALLGLWWVGVMLYEWLDGHTDEEPLRS